MEFHWSSILSSMFQVQWKWGPPWSKTEPWGGKIAKLWKEGFAIFRPQVPKISLRWFLGTKLKYEFWGIPVHLFLGKVEEKVWLSAKFVKFLLN